jgi:hypothetical protein
MRYIPRDQIGILALKSTELRAHRRFPAQYDATDISGVADVTRNATNGADYTT